MRRLLFAFSLMLLLAQANVFAQSSFEYDEANGTYTRVNEYGHKVVIDAHNGNMTFEVSLPSVKESTHQPVYEFMWGFLWDSGEILSDMNDTDSVVCMGSYVLGKIPAPFLSCALVGVRERYHLRVVCGDKSITFKTYSSSFEYPAGKANSETYNFKSICAQAGKVWALLLENRERYFTTVVRLLQEFIIEHDKIHQETDNYGTEH